MLRIARAATTSIAVATLAAGCAVTTADGERLSFGSDAFQAYVERVFRQQNRVATDVAFALEAEDLSPERAAELAAAEQSLLEACADLNALAAARRDGRASSVFAEARAARSGPGCEQAARAAQRTLEDGNG